VATEPTLRKILGRPFAEGEAIPAALDGVASKLREANYLRDLPREDFAERAADIMSELNAIHPFREGNGRTQRAFMELLAYAAGHELDFEVVSKERMIQASIAAHEDNDPSMMRRMFDEISDPARTALLREGIEKLQGAFDREAQRTGKEPVSWNDRYVATLTPGHSVELVLAGIAGDQFMARTDAQILFGKTSDLPDPHPERGERFTVTPARATADDAPRSYEERLADREKGYRAESEARQAEATPENSKSHPASRGGRGD
jgi:cell filamentation protein